MLLYEGKRFDTVLATADITAMVQPGANVIEIDYEPFNTETRSYTPLEDLRLQVRLTRSSNALDTPQLREEVILLSGSYDVVRRMMVATETSAFNEGPVIREDGGLRVTREYALHPVTISQDQAMRISLPFRIDDIAMTTPPWVSAPERTDTPALRT